MCLSVNNQEKIKEILTNKKMKLSVGESCTGGLISSYLTDVDGASNFIEINFVTYSEEAKQNFLFVPKNIIEKFGVVSFETAKYMAKGLLKYSDFSISTTGYASSNNGDKINSKGTVYFAFGHKENIKVSKYISDKTERIEIKKDMTEHILSQFVDFVKEELTVKKTVLK